MNFPAKILIIALLLPIFSQARARAESLNPRLECDPVVIAAFEKAWKDSGEGWGDDETGFRVDLIDGDLAITMMPRGKAGVSHEIEITINRFTIAVAHTHPSKVSPMPSWRDAKSPVPNYVISKWNLYITDPKTGMSKMARGNDWAKPCR